MRPLRPKTRRVKPSREEDEERRETRLARPAKQLLSPRDTQLRRYHTKA